MIIRILIFFLISLPIFSFSQILNIDKQDTSAYSKKATFSMNFSTGLEVDKQKTTLYDATNTAEAMLQQKKNLFIFAGNDRFTYNGSTDILNTGYFHFRYRYGYKNKYQPELYTQMQWDDQRGMEHRFIIGGNLRYNIWKGDKLDFNAGTGLMYEDERWDYVAVDSAKIPANAQPITNHLLKSNSYVRFDWKTSATSEITLNVFLQTRFNSFLPRIAPHLQWNISAGKHIGFSINFTALYDAAPVVPIENFFYSLSNSIMVKW